MDDGIHIFPTGISPKVNVTTRLEFELTFEHFSQYATEIPVLTSQGVTEWFLSLVLDVTGLFEKENTQKKKKKTGQRVYTFLEHPIYSFFSIFIFIFYNNYSFVSIYLSIYLSRK